MKRWSALVQPGEWLHLARFRFLPERRSRYHTHDFAEIFWLEEGEAGHHINGATKRLRPGDLVLVRPSDCHVLETRSPSGFALVNLAFARRAYDGLRRRFPVECGSRWDPSPRLPHRAELSPQQLGHLTAQLERLAQEGRGRLVLENFLSALFLILEESPGRSSPASPAWLRLACERIREPAYFRLGANGLVKASGRSAEHVARTVRAALDQTPSDYVNRVRMDHAAKELRVTTHPIMDIALDCGISNLSHFYALFRAAHGTTPRRYRTEHQRQIL